MPQLDIFIYPHLIVYTIILFISLTFFFFNYILPKILKIMKVQNILCNFTEQNASLPIKVEHHTYEKMIALQKQLEKRKNLIKNIANVK